MTSFDRSTAIQQAHHALDKFLEVYRTSDDGGYAKFTEEDEIKFWDLFYIIRNAKFGRDVDGDYPINFKLINRTKFEPMNFSLLKYLHHMETVEDLIKYIDLAQSNVKMASNTLDCAMHVLKDKLKEKKSHVKF